MKLAARLEKEGIQLSYAVPHHIYDAKVHPRKSANGSTVIIYGHGEGVRVVWYAGRRFKTTIKSPPATSKVNGTSSNDAMVIDLDVDEDEGAPQSKAESAEFEEEEEEVDHLRPYGNVLRDLEIPTGSAALHVAIAEEPADFGQLEQQSNPEAFTRIILAVACADLSMRLLAIPLNPPAPDVLQAEAAGVKAVQISGSNSHQDLIVSLAVAYTGVGTNMEHAGSPNRGRSTDPRTDETQQLQWSLLMASVSCTGSGLLLLHQLPLDDKNIISNKPENLLPNQRQYLRTPLHGCKLHFNPAAYPAERHLLLLIAIPETGQTRLYQPFPESANNKERRGSAATIDSTASSTRSPKAGIKRAGRFLISLYPGFGPSDHANLCPRRKRVLDANWIMNGRSIIALFEDGEWGIWDIGAAGPASGSSGNNPLQGEGSISGIQGGSLTSFAIRGTVRPKKELAASKAAAGKTSQDGLAPMTPHTRKVRAQGLFQGEPGTQAQAQNEETQLEGSIVVKEIIASQLYSANKTIHDESVVLSYGTSRILIPNIQAYWRSEVGRKGSLDAASSKLLVLPSLRLGGETPQAFALLPTLPNTNDNLIDTSSSTPDFLVATTTRLILFVQPLLDADAEEDGVSHVRSMPLRNQDQMLLSAGELDVDGVDRILDNMAQGPSSTQPARPNFGKSVGFVDDDVDMNSPTPGRRTRLALGKAAGTPRKLFS